MGITMDRLLLASLMLCLCGCGNSQKPSEGSAPTSAKLESLKAEDMYDLHQSKKLNYGQRIQITGNVFAASATKASYRPDRVLIQLVGTKSKVQKERPVYLVFTPKSEFGFQFTKWLESLQEGQHISATGKLIEGKDKNDELVIELHDVELDSY